MIQVISTYNTKSQAFGWVQDPSNMKSLCDVVAIFYNKSLKHKELINEIIPKLVSKVDCRDRLLKSLKSDPLKITYLDLVGTCYELDDLECCVYLNCAKAPLLGIYIKMRE